MEVHDNEDMLRDFINNKLRLADIRKIKRHIERCEECRRKVARFAAPRLFSDVRDASRTTCEDMLSLMKMKIKLVRKDKFLSPAEERLIQLHLEEKKCRKCRREYDKLVEMQFDLDEKRTLATVRKPTSETGISIVCKPHGSADNIGKMGGGMKILPPPAGVKGFTSLSSLSIGLKGDAVPSAKTRKKTNKTGNKTLSSKKK